MRKLDSFPSIYNSSKAIKNFGLPFSKGYDGLSRAVMPGTYYVRIWLKEYLPIYFL